MAPEQTVNLTSLVTTLVAQSFNMESKLSLVWNLKNFRRQTGVGVEFVGVRAPKKKDVCQKCKTRRKNDRYIQNIAKVKKLTTDEKL